MCAAKFKHLSLQDRFLIEQELNHNSSFKKIALATGKDCSTISKEVRLNLSSSKFIGFNVSYNPCLFRNSCDQINLCSPCKYKREHLCRNCKSCTLHCLNFKEELCDKLLLPPYVCNACSDLHKCRLTKHLYDAAKAHAKYTEKKSFSRCGIVISDDDIKRLNILLVPLIKNQKQSIHHVYLHHKDEIMFSERTLYKIIDAGCLSVKNIDLPTKVRRRVRHSKPTCKVDTKCRQGRTFDDFKSFIDEYPDTAIVQMDTVIGRKGGKVLLTLHLVNCSFMLAFIRDYNDSRSVIDIFNHLYNLLGADTFKQLFPIILTDNGSEFSNPSELELSGEDKRTRIFYCDPSAPYQKGACEVNHEFIRKFTPKGKSIDDWNQDKVNKMMSHINGYGRKKLNGKSPADLFIELYGETVFNQLGLQRLLPDEIHLSKQLFKEDSN